MPELNQLVAHVAARVVEGVIVLTLLEGLAMAWHHRRTGRGIAPLDGAAMLAAGLCLMFALRSALVDGPGPALAGWLALAGLAHGADLWRRWRRAV